MQFLQIYRVVKVLTEVYYLYEELPHFIQNMLQSILSQANKTTTDYIKFLNEQQTITLYLLNSNTRI